MQLLIISLCCACLMMMIALVDCFAACLQSYVDTDSCLLTAHHQDIEKCVLEEKRDLWNEARIMVDTESLSSQHGKMKVKRVKNYMTK
jgi:hypothetical protein